jgi:cytochrome c553
MTRTRKPLRKARGATTGALAAAAAAMLLVSPALAADLEAGKKKVTEICQACHGMDGNSPIPDNPKLAGQYRDYLAKALRDYKSGARKNPVMQGMAGTLTPQDIENIAAYYSAQPAVLESKM